MHTPRRNGEFSKAGDFDLLRILFRPFRTSWLIVGIAAVVFNVSFPSFLGKERGIYQRSFLLQQVFQRSWIINPPGAFPPVPPLPGAVPLRSGPVVSMKPCGGSRSRCRQG